MAGRLMSGNEACAEGAIAAGVRFFAGYPISPSSEIAEVMARRLPQLGGTFIQMEEEIASLCAAIGASLAGVRAMDATSGPGLSLKAEALGMAVMMEVPVVLVDAQRVGPSTGMATSPSQGDTMLARWGTHGDHPMVALAPSSVSECFWLTARAVSISERFRTPVLVLTDAAVARMREVVEVPESVDTWERPRPMGDRAQYRPYASGPDGVPAMADFGSGYRWYANSSMHDERGFEATSRPEVATSLIERLHAKIERNRDAIVEVESLGLEDAEVALVAYGSAARAARGAVRVARAGGLGAGLLRLLTLWPFPELEVSALRQRVKAIVVPEMNRGQMVDKVREVVAGRTRVVSLPRYDGQLITPEQVLVAVQEALAW